MVSISIMSIVAAIIMSRQDAFNGSILLRNQAFKIALAVREVQLSAVSASGDAGDFRTVYGIYFDATTDTFQVFKDADDDGWYDPGNEEVGQVVSLDPRFDIDGFSTGGDELSVVFERPNFDAHFFESANNESTDSSVTIDIIRGDTPDVTCGEKRTVEITKTGQIAVIDCP
jgi:type II secretory pathway pseudopilin PulG